MIYLVDNTVDGQGASPREILAGLQRVRPDLEVVLDPFHQVTPARVCSLAPSHIILSGQSHPWDRYSPESLQGVFDLIREAAVPVLGVCGGHQQMAIAFGAPVGLMERLEPGEGYSGAKRERGYYPVETNGSELFRDLQSTSTYWHSHCDEVKELPSGFHRTAFNATCQIQAMEHESKPLFGVQFHPELFDDEHPDGGRLLLNFLSI